MKYLKIKTLSLFAITVLILQSCTTNTVKITNGKLTIEINQNLKTKINHSIANVDPINTKFVYSEFLIGKNNEFYNFKKSSYNKSKNIDSVGKYTLHTIIGNYSLEGYNLTKVLNIKIYDTIADFAVFNVNYINNGTKIIEPEKWVNNYGTITPTVGDTILWSFQGESTDSRADWILPVTKGFFQKNYMGMNNSDYGGGIPVVDLWNRNIGIAKGHLELSPKLVSTPVRQKLYSNSAESWIEYNIPEDIMLEKGDTLKTFETFIDIHKGDCFIPLQTFSHVTRLKGLKFVKSEETAFEPIWCAWGYERDFTIKEVLGTLPKVKELGFKWVVLDDGFQQAEGDWKLNRHKFPNGDTDMINFVNTIHKYGLKAKLWYAPLAADPESKLYKNNKDMILLDKGEVPRYISWGILTIYLQVVKRL
jgi:alpha-galactosidase